MTSNMDPMKMVQGTKMRGIPPKSLGVAWWRSGDVMVCYMMNEGSKMANTS